MVTIKPVKTLWSYAVAVGAREQKDHSKCRAVGGSGAGGFSYILKGCVQLYEQEGSLCTCVLGLQHNSLTLWAHRVVLVIGASSNYLSSHYNH